MLCPPIDLGTKGALQPQTGMYLWHDSSRREAAAIEGRASKHLMDRIRLGRTLPLDKPERTSGSCSNAPEPQPAAFGALTGLLAQGVQALCLTATGIYLTHILSASSYGQYAVIVSLVLWVEIVVASGLGESLARACAGKPELWRTFGGRATILGGSTAIIAAVTVIALSGGLATILQDMGLKPYLLLYALDVPFFAPYMILRGALNGTRQFSKLLWALVAYPLSRLVLVFVLVALRPTVTQALFASLGGSIVALAAALVLVRPRIWGTSLRGGGIATVGAMATVFPVLRMLYDRLDLWAVKALVTDASAAGYYGAAVMLGGVALMFVGAIASGLGPSLYAAVQSNDQQWAQDVLRQALRAVMLGILPIFGVLAGCSSELLGLLFPSAYSAAATPLVLLFAASICMGFIALGSVCAVARRTPLVAGALMLLQVVCVVGLYALWVPKCGMLGAAAGKLAVAGVFACISIAVMHRWFGALPSLLDFGKVAPISALVFGASWAWDTPGWLVLVKGSLLLALAFGALWGLGAIKAGDFRNLLIRNS